MSTTYAAEGGEFRVNTAVGGNQLASSVCRTADGGFVVTWQSSDGDGYGIYAQRFNSDGLAASGEFLVNSTTAFNQYDPSVAGLVSGGFVVTWTSYAQDGSGAGVYAQMFGSNGQPEGIEFRVSTAPASDQYESSLAPLSGGGYVVSWTSNGQDGSAEGVYAQIFDAAGGPVGGELRINYTTQDVQVNRAIAALPNGGFVASWVSYAQDGSDAGALSEGWGRC